MLETLIPLYCLTGFVGSGKTTALLSILRQNPDKKIGVIFTEPPLLHRQNIQENEDISIEMLDNGSLQCSCSEDALAQALVFLPQLLQLLAQGLQLGGLLGLLLQGAVLLFQRDHPAAQLVHLAGDFLQGVVAPLQVLHAGPGLGVGAVLDHVGPLLVPDLRLHLQLVHPPLKLLALPAVFPGVIALFDGHGWGGCPPGA